MTYAAVAVTVLLTAAFALTLWRIVRARPHSTGCRH